MSFGRLIEVVAVQNLAPGAQVVINHTSPVPFAFAEGQCPLCAREGEETGSHHEPHCSRFVPPPAPEPRPELEFDTSDTGGES